MLAEMKLCPDCGTERPVHEFGRNRPARDGLSTYCRTHNNRRHNEWIARRGGHRRLNLRNQYGMTIEQFDDLLAAQNGCCAICLTDEPGGKGDQWHVDHDHATGVVRGILCALCNVGLGHFGDDSQRLESAAQYLKGNN